MTRGKGFQMISLYIIIVASNFRQNSALLESHTRDFSQKTEILKYLT